MNGIMDGWMDGSLPWQSNAAAKRTIAFEVDNYRGKVLWGHLAF